MSASKVSSNSILPIIGFTLLSTVLLIGIWNYSAQILIDVWNYSNQPESVFTVYEKQFLPASAETVTEGSLFSQKAVEYVYPDRWCVMVTYEHNGNLRIRDYYVTKDVYEEISVGDIYIYTPERGDLCDPPCIKNKI